MVTDSPSEIEMLSFSDRVRQRARTTGTWLCVGIDPQVEQLPAGIARDAGGVTSFCRRIVHATRGVAACYKINFAFFEALGVDGWRALADVRATVPESIPVIADAKRGDIGSTSAAYARAVFDELRFDAVTVNPYLGWDALEPFMQYHHKCLLVLCKTSNPGGGNLQDLRIGSEPLYMRIARQAQEQNARAEIGLVMGGTYPAALREVRALSEDLVLLVPGIGVQGGRAGKALAAGSNGRSENALISVSRDILYASSGPDFAEAAGAAARCLAGMLGAKP